MGKALMVYGPSAGINALTNGSFFPLGGIGQNLVTESRSHFKLTEAATFSGLAWRHTAGSGTNTMRFRKNSANGNQVASRDGAGFAEDTTNSDVCVDNDLVNHSFAETGSNADAVFVRENVEFSSGHGNFHICANAGSALNLNFSATRYFPISGALATPQITIATAQWKNRGYTSVEALQVNVISNARVNATTFKVNVNGVNQGTLTIGAGIVGLQEVTGLGIALADGDLVCVEWSAGAGSQSFLLTSIALTLKSTSLSSEIMGQRLLSAGYTRAASATPSYLKLGGNLEAVSSEADARIRVGFECVGRNLRTYIQTNTCTGDQTFKLFVNGVAVITKTIGAGVTGWVENEDDTSNFDDNDEACYEVVGGTSGSCLFRAAGITFSPLVAGGVVRHMVQYYQEAA